MPQLLLLRVGVASLPFPPAWNFLGADAVRESLDMGVVVQAAWRGWRVRQAAQRARAAIPGQLGSTEDELSAESLDGLLGATPSNMEGVLGAQEVLRPELAHVSSPKQRAPLAAKEEEWPKRTSLLPARAGSSASSSHPNGRVRSASSHAGAPNWAGCGRAAQSVVQHKPPSAPPQAAGDWGFTSEATAAAFMQLRQRQQAQARKREVREQLRDPVARLHAFQLHRTQGTPAAAPTHSTSRQPSLVASQAGGGGPGASSGRGSGAPSPGSWCSLPPLREPGAVGAAAGGRTALHPKSLLPFGL